MDFISPALHFVACLCSGGKFNHFVSFFCLCTVCILKFITLALYLFFSCLLEEIFPSISECGMAMAEVYYPDVISAPMDDSSSVSLPRAPPPSPEVQPRGLSNKFEFPASKWEGIGLDLTRNSFAFDEESEGGASETCFRSDHMKSHEMQARHSDLDEDEDESYYAYSPRKRVCCASNNLLSEGHAHTITAASLSCCGASSLASSGFGSFHDNILQEGGVGVAVVGGGGVVGLDAGILNGTLDPALPTVDLSACHHNHSQAHSKPHLIPPRPDVVEGGAVLMRDPFSPSYFSSHGEDLSEQQQQQNSFSHSFDLHATHPHLPQSFETTQLPRVRPGRSRTLDVTSLQKTLAPPPESLSETDLDGSQRKRKISIKRKNPEEIENDPLQFSFDYSYSSTGSTGESDWVLVDRQMEGVCPLEKKPCGGHHSGKQVHPFLFNGNSLAGTLQQHQQLEVSQGTALSPSVSPFLGENLESKLEEVRAVCGSPTHEQLQAASSMGMGKTDRLEEMETTEMEVEPSLGTGSDSTTQSSNFQHTCVTVSQRLLRPCPPKSQEAGSGGNSPGLLSIPSRRSCMEGFLYQNYRTGGLWSSDRNGECIQMESEAETKINMSKSL